MHIVQASVKGSIPRHLVSLERIAGRRSGERSGPLIKNVRQGDSTALYEDQLIPIWRNGRIEDVYWTFTYTSVYDEAENVAGVLVVVTETTTRVVSERRQETLAWLTKQFRSSQSANAVLELLQRAAQRNPRDLPAIGLEPFPTDFPLDTLKLRARDLGMESDLELHFGLSDRMPLDEPYREFLRNLTVSTAGMQLDIQTRRIKELTVADRDQLLMDAPIGAAVLIGKNLVFQLANAFYHEMVGREALEGKTFDDVFPELLGTPVRLLLQQALETGRPYIETEMPVHIFRYGVGEISYFNFSLTPLRHPSGGIYGVMVMVIDITEHVAARKQTELMNNELQAAVRSKDEFLAMLGHELRNPLAPIVTALQLIKLKQHTMTDEHLLIQRQVNHLVRLVDDLLDISRITKGIVELRKKRVDLQELVSRAVEMAEDLLERNKHHLTLEVPAVDLVCDPARIAQVIANLLTNAARYTEPGGHIQLRAWTKGELLRVEVEDNGIGVSSNLLPDIFDLFVQGKRNPDRSEGGLGIGLSLVKNLVELHDGQVAAQSRGEGQGSTFSIMLPLCVKLEDEAHRSAPDLEVIDKPGCDKILLVDDNAEAVNSLAELLQLRGFKVSTVYNPVQAIELFSRQSFDVAVLDIGLPEMDGYELLTHLRNLPRKSPCRFIALSGYGQAKDKARSQETGFSHHLVKPIESSDLVSILRTDRSALVDVKQ